MSKFGKPHKLIATMLGAVITLASVCGCENSGKTIDVIAPMVTETVNKQTSMLEEYEIAYEAEPMKPAILVDLYGYEPKAVKQAVVEAGLLPSGFEVVEKETGRVVYTGTLKLRECPEDGERMSAIADFTGIEVEGEYYVRTDLLGRSKDFCIKENIYEDLMRETILGLHNLRCGHGDHANCHSAMALMEDDLTKQYDVSGGWHTNERGEKDVVDGCLAVLDLLMAYDYYPKSFLDDTGIEESGNSIPDILDEAMYEASWLLKMQDQQTGGVYTSVSYQQTSTDDVPILVVGGETTRATAYFCTAMARMSYVVNPYDWQFSNACMKAANLAWKCLDANKELVTSEQMYRAAVEMYRATGLVTYNSVISSYLKENVDKGFESRITLDAAIDYMDSTRGVNLEYCTTLMQNFMDRTEEKANASKESRYLVEPAVEGEESEVLRLLRNGFEISVVNYIISNEEYTKISQNYVHYLCGRNENSEICKDLVYSPDAYAQFLMILGKLVIKTN